MSLMIGEIWIHGFKLNVRRMIKILLVNKIEEDQLENQKSRLKKEKRFD